MKNVPGEVLDSIKDTARRRGSTYLMTYEISGDDVPDAMRSGYISVDPGLSLKDALDRAALSDDLVGRTLTVKEVFNLKTNQLEAGFPAVIQGLPSSLQPTGRTLN